MRDTLYTIAMLLSIQFPSFISPEIIPGLPFRWYGLMYIFAFGTAYMVYRKVIRERHFPMDDDGLSGLFFWGILGLLLGARIFSALVYEPPETNIFLRRPWLIFWPFQNGRFTGFQGMSFHGGVIGGIIGSAAFARVKRISLREIGDMWAYTIPLGYTFGRLGNFLNQELYGRVTTSPLGMIFPDAGELFSRSLAWVREIAEKTGIPLPTDPQALVNLPRFPSQLFEALFEGLVLWSIIWLIRKKAPFKGFLLGAYFFGYSLIRFVIEYFREPDADLGFRIQLGQVVKINEIGYLHPLTSFSTGQILCVLMMLGSVIWWIIASKLPNSQFTYYYPEDGGHINGENPEKPEEEKKLEKNARRNLRKKLK
jgi:phosphatidylglycerol:prolipoprotein diacylglycerol transferase